jgi:hypothetical protein
MLEKPQSRTRPQPEIASEDLKRPQNGREAPFYRRSTRNPENGAQRYFRAARGSYFDLGVLGTSLSDRPPTLQVAFPGWEILAVVSHVLYLLNLPSQRFLGEIRHSEARHPIDDVSGLL